LGQRLKVLVLDNRCAARCRRQGRDGRRDRALTREGVGIVLVADTLDD